MTTASHDVVIVGGGGAGLRAAIAVAETDPRLSVAIVSKVYPMRSHTVSAEGGAAGGRSAPTTASTSTPTTRSPAATGCATRTPSRRSSRRPPRSCCGSSTGAVRGAASRTGTSRCAPFGGMKKSAPGSPPTRPASTCSTRCSRPRSSTTRITRYDEWFVTQAAGRRRPGQRRRRDRADVRPDRGDHRQGGHPRAPAAAAGSSRSPPTPTSRPATAWPWPTGPARRSRTWSSSSTTRPVCRSPAS